MGAGKQLKMTLIPMSSAIRVEVFNAAVHIPTNELEKLWESFYKVDKARSRECGGHGLGLSIVKAIQEAHHQAYGVTNVPEGLCFWVDIAKSTGTQPYSINQN